MVGSPQVILRRFASIIKREGVGSFVLTGMLSGFPSLHTPVWKLNALAGLAARDDPALRSAKRLLGSKRSAPAVVLCLQSRTIHQGVLLKSA
jgi:hypothetical protein